MYLRKLFYFGSDEFIKGKFLQILLLVTVGSGTVTTNRKCSQTHRALPPL